MENASFIQLRFFPDKEAEEVCSLVKTLNTGMRGTVAFLSKDVFAKVRQSDPEILARLPPGLTSNQQKSIFRSAENKVSTAVALKREEIKRLSLVIGEQRNSILKTKERIASRTKGSSSVCKGAFAGKGSWKNERLALAKKGERLERLEARLERAVQSLRDESVSIVFGGRKLARQGNQLKDKSSPFKTRKHWRNAWENARNGGWMFEGDKSVSSLNKAVKVKFDEDGNVWIRVQLSLAQKRERLAALAKEAGISFEDALEDKKHGNMRKRAAYAVLRCSQPKDSSKSQRRRLEEFKEILAKGARPVSWQVSVAKGLDGRISNLQMRAVWESDPVPVFPCKKGGGVLAIDLNAWGVAWAIVDGLGNWTGRSGSIRLAWRGSEERALHEIRKACKKLTDMALRFDVPIALEALDFAKKKIEMRSERKSRASKILSGFAYSSFRDELLAKSGKTGVRVVFVDPAWTSITGFVLHALPSRRLSIDQGAAVSIGRRAVLSKGSDVVLKSVPGLSGKREVCVRNERLSEGLLERLAAIEDAGREGNGLAAGGLDSSATSEGTVETKQSGKKTKGIKGPVAKRVGRQGAVRRSTNPLSGVFKRLVLVLGRDRRLWRKRGSPLLPEGSLKQRDRPTEGDRRPVRQQQAESAGTSRPDPNESEKR